MSKTIKLKLNYSTRDFEDISNIDSSEFMRKLLSQGYEDLVLTGIPIKECTEGIHLWVEQDADSLVDSYQYLEELCLKREDFEHYTFLNDGLFEIIAKSNGEIIEIVYEFCPGLNQANLIKYSEKIGMNQYLWLWRNIVYDLIAFATLD